MMMNRRAALIITIVLLLVGFSTDHYFEKRKYEQKHTAYAGLIPLIAISESDDFIATVDKVRQFIFAHTQYSEGQDFRDIWGDHPAIAQKISRHARGETDVRAPLECSGRSGIMESIFITLGYNVRSVSIFNYGDDYGAHTFSEVQNPETGKWQIQDSQYNVFWQVKETGERASVVNLVSQSFDDYEPCRASGYCGWDLPNREEHNLLSLQRLLGLASIKDYQRGKRPLLVNTRRFDLKEILEVDERQGIYCDLFEKNCRENVMMY